MNTNIPVDVLREKRLQVDLLLNSARLLPGSREVALLITYLQRVKGFLGKALGESGQGTPYKESENSESKVIEKQADHTNDTLADVWAEKGVIDHVAKVKDLRHRLSVLVTDLKQLTDDAIDNTLGRWYAEYLTTAVIAAEDSKMWLGWELDRIHQAGGDFTQGDKPKGLQ